MVVNPCLRPQYGKRGEIGQIDVEPSPSCNKPWAETPHWKAQIRQTQQDHAPIFALNALDEDCNVKNKPSNPDEALKAIFGTWLHLSQAERDRFLEIVAKPDENQRSHLIQKGKSTHLAAASKSAASTSKVGRGKKARSELQSKVNPRKRKEYVEEDSDEEDWEPLSLPQDLPSISIRVDDREKVEAFLYTRFMQIQQSACKIIAKAWIKAICPKKQASYPYVDCNPRLDQPRRNPRYPGPPRVPIFWPALELCRHKEPDHVDKNERTYLLVHLIRLMWGPVEWKQSNGETCEVPNFVMTGDWIQFLKDVFPPEKLTEMPGCSPEKTKQRMQFLDDIYRVALAEQEFHQGGNDGRTVFTFSGDIKLMYPKDARPRPRRPKMNNADTDKAERIEMMESGPGPKNAVPATTASFSPTGGSATSSRSSDGDSCSNVRASMMVSEKDDEVDCAAANISTSLNKTISSAPWIMTGHADSNAGVIEGVMSHPQTFKEEAPSESSVLEERNNRFGRDSPYIGTQTPPGYLAMEWHPSFSPYVPFQPSNFGSDMRALDGLYRQHMVTLNPMVAGLPLCTPPAEPPYYGQESRMYGPVSNAVHPMTYSTAPAQDLMNGGILAEGQQGRVGEQQQMQYTYGRHPNSMLTQSFPQDMPYIEQATGRGERDFGTIDAEYHSF